MNKKSIESSKLDLGSLFGLSQNQDNRMFVKPVVNVYEFYLSGNIEAADEYIQWFDIIRHASENDVVKIYINSYGGDVFTAIQFMRVLQETPASIVMSVEGACMSAATMIFMSGQSFEVSEHSMFMFHNYSGGTIGKGGEMLDQLQHERKWSDRMYRDIYNEFLSTVEIDSMLNNKDLWMDGHEVIQRLKKKKKKVEQTSSRKKTSTKPPIVPTPQLLTE